MKVSSKTAVGLSIVAGSMMAIYVLITVLQFLNVDLKIEAMMNRRALSKIVILDNKKTIASAQPNGDILTGSSSPATASFDTNNSLVTLKQEVENNLKSQGFQMADIPDSIRLYSANDSYDFLRVDSQLTGLAIRATKDNKSLVVNYIFNEGYSCNDVCPETISLTDTEIYNKQVKLIRVIYDNTSDVRIFAYNHTFAPN